MAAFPTSGIQLVVKGYSDYIGKMGRVGRAYSDQSKKIEQLKARLSSYSAALRNNGATQGRLLRSIESLNKQLDEQDEALSNLKEGTTEWESAHADMINTMERAAEEYDKLIGAQENGEAIMKRMGIASSDLTGAEEELLSVTSRLAPAFGAFGVAIAAAGVSFNFLKNQTKDLVNFFKNLASTIVNVLTKAVNIAIGAFNSLVGAIKKILSPITSFISRIVSIASGIALYDFIRSIIYGFKQLANEILDSLAAFQKLEVRFETIIARDIANRAMIPYAEATELATEKTQELVDWIRVLAVTTPFTVEDISQVVALGAAMGMSVSEAQRLTIAIGNYASALGLSDEVLYRTIYNLGQMIQRGRLTGEEFRDLSRNLFPVYEVLERIGEQTGQTAEEMKSLALEGGVAVQDFINEFISLAEEDFPDSMQRLSQTWGVLIQNIREFFNVFVGLDIFGPVFQKITDQAAQALDNLVKSPVLQQTTKLLGETLAQGFDRLTPIVNELSNAFLGLLSNLFPIVGLAQRAGQSVDYLGRSMQRNLEEVKDTLHPVTRAILMFAMTVIEVFKIIIQNITKAVQGIAEKTGSTFADMARNAAQWGANVIAMFAKGMAAAITLVVQVLNTLASILASFLRGRSPPKVAPNIDKWGADAMREYMLGWLKYDFDVFNKIGDLLEKYLRSLGDRLEGTKLVERILGTREALARGLNDFRRGMISLEEAINRVMRAAKDVTQDFRNYIRLIFEVAKAQKDYDSAQARAAAAQAKLNQVTERYNAILDSLRRQLSQVTEEYDETQRLRKIDEALASGLLTAQEKERLEMEKRGILIERQIRDVEDQRDAEVAILEARISAAEREAELAQQRLDATKDQLDAAEALIEVQIKQNDLLQEWIDALEQAKDAMSSAAGAMAEAADEVSNALTNLGAGGIALPEIPWDQMWAEAEKAAQNFWTTLFGGEVDGKPVEGILSPFTELFDEGGPISELETAFGNLKTVIGDVFSTEKVDTFFGAIQNFIDKLFGPKQKTKGLGDAIPEMETGGGIFATLEEIFSPEAFQKYSDAITPLLTAISNVGETLGGAFEPLGAFLNDDTATASDKIAKALELIAIAIGVKLAPKVGFMIALATVFQTLASTIGFVSEQIGQAAEAFETLKTTISGYFTGEALFSELKEAFAVFLVEAVQAGMALFTQAILAPLEAVIAFIGGWVGGVIKWFVDLFNDLVGNSIIPDKMADVKEAFLGPLQEVADFVSETLANIEKWFDDHIGAARDFVVNDALPAIQNAWDTTIGTIVGFIEDTFGPAIETIRTEILEPFKEFWEGPLTDALNTFYNDVLTPLFDQFTNLKLAIKGVWEWIGKLADALLSLDIGRLISLLFAGPKVPGQQEGGRARAGQPYIVGEKRPEVFVPDTNGIIIPSVTRFRNQLERNMFGGLIASPNLAGNGNGGKVINIEINPTYKNVESMADIYYDVSAALAVANL